MLEQLYVLRWILIRYDNHLTRNYTVLHTFYVFLDIPQAVFFDEDSLIITVMKIN
jgi:hypothetical protein